MGVARASPSCSSRPVSGAALLLAGCGGGDDEASRALTGPEHEAGLEPTRDPKYLVPQLSDLPARFSLVPGETFPTPLAWVLADPWSAGYAAVIRRERVAGYQTSFWNPVHERIECSAAVYRSSSGAGRVFRLRNERFRAFLAVRESGRPADVERIGEETTAFRFVIGRSKGLTVAGAIGTSSPRVPACGCSAPPT